jgi:hypothetical protein
LTSIEVGAGRQEDTLEGNEGMQAYMDGSFALDSYPMKIKLCLNKRAVLV